MRPRGKYDLELGTVGCIVVGADRGEPVWRVESIPAEADQTATIAEVPARWDTWHLGYGFGERHVDGCYHYAENIDARWPGMLIMGPLVTTVTLTADGTNRVSSIFEQVSGANTYLYVLHGRYCSRIDLTNDTEVAIPNPADADGIDFGSSVVATKAVAFQDDANAVMTYVGFSGSTNIYEFSGTAWTQATDNVDALYWTKDWSDAANSYRVWRALGTNSVRTCPTGSDPLLDASWSTAWTVGDTSAAITGMVAADYNVVFVAKRDGLYRLDPTGRNHNVLDSVGFLRDADNGVNVGWDGHAICYPHLLGLLEYEPGSNEIRAIHPGAATGNRSPVRGIVTAQAFAGIWHWVAIYNGTDTYLLAGRYPTAGEALPPGWVGPKIWHPLVKLASVRCDALHFSGLTSPPRLWFGSGVNVAYIRIPKSGDVAAEADTGNLRFAASGSIYLSPRDWVQPGAPKALLGVDIENVGLSTSTYVDAYWRLDGGGWQHWGRATERGRTTLRLPSGTWRPNQAELRFDVTNGDTTATPRIKPIIAKAAIRPKLRDLVTTAVSCEDNGRLRDGSPDRRKGASILLSLQELAEAVPVTGRHWWTGSEQEQTVIVHQARPTMVKQREDKPAVYAAEVVFSVLDELGVTLYYDSGLFYDSGYRYT